MIPLTTHLPQQLDVLHINQAWSWSPVAQTTALYFTDNCCFKVFRSSGIVYQEKPILCLAIQSHPFFLWAIYCLGTFFSKIHEYHDKFLIWLLIFSGNFFFQQKGYYHTSACVPLAGLVFRWFNQVSAGQLHVRAIRHLQVQLAHHFFSTVVQFNSKQLNFCFCISDKFSLMMARPLQERLTRHGYFSTWRFQRVGKTSCENSFSILFQSSILDHSFVSSWHGESLQYNHLVRCM